jgi:hypothetical protein
MRSKALGKWAIEEDKIPQRVATKGTKSRDNEEEEQ